MEHKDAQKLIKNRDALIKSFLKGKEPDFLEKHTAILDEYFFTVFEKSIAARKITVSGAPFAIIALGGYGRKEQCIHSDIDLLILFEKKVPPEVEAFVQEILYPLWDARFEVGYAVRNIKECIDMAFERFDILTTVLDARFICGASLIYSSFKEKFRQALSGRKLKKTLNYLYEHGEKRHFDFGDSTYLIAPDLKSGFGGLRDYHTLLWYAKIKSDIKTRRDLEYYGFLSHFEYQELKTQLDEIWKIRNFLHHLAKRKCDTLHFEYQSELAKMLGYRSKKRQPAVEAFLGSLHNSLDFLKQINQITFEDLMGSYRVKKGHAEPRPTKTEGLVIKKRRLHFANTVAILQNPELLVKIFLESGQRKIPLSIEARRVVSEFLHLVDDIRLLPSTIKIFKKIMTLSYWEFNVLNVMLGTGILQKFIPEFTHLVNKIQYNHYHLFPVDKHSIRCVQVVNSFKENRSSGEYDLYTSVFKDVRNKNVLYFAALLHDIGKSDPAKEHSKRGARITRPIMERFGFSPTEVDDAVFLVENHLLMAKIATRRDIGDEETAISTANAIGKIRLLRMLYLLTVADSKATGPKAWNEWTENLLKELFMKTMGVLKRGELATKKTQRLIEKKKTEVLRLLMESWREDEITRQMDSFPRRYMVNMPAKDIVDHILLHRKIQDRDFVWNISEEDNAPDIRTVSICGKDRPGLYSKIAGVFFLNDLDIIASQAYSFGKQHVLDIFKVTPPKDRLFEKEKWEKTEEDLKRAIQDDHFLDQALDKIPRELEFPPGRQPEPNVVRVDNETSSFFTIIEVFTYDFPGLLFSITNALYRNNADVNVAMVATKVDQVIDIFYIKNYENDAKIETEQGLDQIKQAILSSLPQVYAKEVANAEN